MNKNLKGIIATGILLIIVFPACKTNKTELTENQQKLQQYNVKWDSPSNDHHGSMPLGNGDISINAWVEESGDICFYIGKTDAWGDNGRLLKVGKVRVKCEPAIVTSKINFSQELDLLTGSIKISTTREVNGKQANLNFNLWVDSNNPVIHLTYDCTVSVAISANIELWRTEPYSLPNLEVSDLLEERSKPGSLHEPVIVEPDYLILESKSYIGWFHTI